MTIEEIREKTEYQKSLNHNYLVLLNEEEEETYQREMFLENRIDNLLQGEIRRRDGRSDYFYEISSMQPLSRIFESSPMRAKEIKNILMEIKSAVQCMRDFLLEEEYLILEPEYMYLDLETKKLKVLFFPYYQRDFSSTLLHLSEYFLEVVDHKDKEAVFLAYRFYKEVQRDTFTMSEIEKFFLEEECLDKEKNWEKDKERNKDRERNWDKERNKDRNKDRERYWDKERENRAEKQEREETFEPENLFESKWQSEEPVRESLDLQGKKKSPAPKENRMSALFGKFKEKWKWLTGEKEDFSKKEETWSGERREDSFWSMQEEYGENPFWKEPEQGGYKASEHGGYREGKRGEYGAAKTQEEGEEYPEETYGKTVFIDVTETKEECALVEYRKGKEKKHVLSQFPVTIGKVRECVDIVLPEESVSRIHAKIFLKEKEVYIKDCNSTNGTYVNGILLNAEEEMMLENSDEIRIGKVCLEYREKLKKNYSFN